MERKSKQKEGLMDTNDFKRLSCFYRNPFLSVRYVMHPLSYNPYWCNS